MAATGRFMVFGGMAGHHDAAADQTTRTERFSHVYDTLEEALAVAEEIATRLESGGSVMVSEEVDNPFADIGQTFFEATRSQEDELLSKEGSALRIHRNTN